MESILFCKRKGHLQEAVDGAYHAKHLTKEEIKKAAHFNQKGGEKDNSHLTHLSPSIFVRKRSTQAAEIKV